METDQRLVRRGAKLHESGEWLCRSCGLPVVERGECENEVEVEVKSKIATICGNVIGRIVKLADVERHHRGYCLEIAHESFTLPGYLREAIIASLGPKKHPSPRKIQMWYTECRETVSHANETCPKRPPLSMREEEARKDSLGRERWV